MHEKSMAHDNAPQSTEVRAASAPATEAVADAQGRVSIDLPCRTCGYVLRGLSVEGNCPECGLAIRQSMRRGRLEDSDPDWLRRAEESTSASALRWRRCSSAFSSRSACRSISDQPARHQPS